MADANYPAWWGSPAFLAGVLNGPASQPGAWTSVNPPAPASNAPPTTPTVMAANPVIAETNWGAFVPLDLGAALTWNPVTPGMIAAAEVGLQNQIYTGLASVQNYGAAEFGTIAGLFNKWGQNQADFSTQVGADLSTVARNSAKACSGFFSCLF